jgi:hypothetical protein
MSDAQISGKSRRPARRVHRTKSRSSRNTDIQKITLQHMHTQNVFARLRLPRKARKLTRFRTAAKYGQAEEPPSRKQKSGEEHPQLQDGEVSGRGAEPGGGANPSRGGTPGYEGRLDIRFAFCPPSVD